MFASIIWQGMVVYTLMSMKQEKEHETGLYSLEGCSLDGLAMLHKYLISNYQREYSMENFRRESTPKLAKKATKTPLKSH